MPYIFSKPAQKPHSSLPALPASELPHRTCYRYFPRNFSHRLMYAPDRLFIHNIKQHDTERLRSRPAKKQGRDKTDGRTGNMRGEINMCNTCNRQSTNCCTHTSPCFTTCRPVLIVQTENTQTQCRKCGRPQPENRRCCRPPVMVAPCRCCIPQNCCREGCFCHRGFPANGGV